MRSMILFAVIAAASVLPVGAQAVRDTQRAGISVVGRATVRAAADSLRFEATISGNLPDAEEDSILAALRAGNVDSVQILYANVLSASTTDVVRGSLRHPTRERVEALAKLAASILAAHPNVRMQAGYVTAFVDNCPKVEEEARRQALDDARRDASAIAAIEGVRLGNISSITEVPSPACLPTESRIPFTGYQGPIEREPAVYVSVTEDVTFSIRY